jgi:hypothetical protein
MRTTAALQKLGDIIQTVTHYSGFAHSLGRRASTLLSQRGLHSLSFKIKKSYRETPMLKRVCNYSTTIYQNNQLFLYKNNFVKQANLGSERYSISKYYSPFDDL